MERKNRIPITRLSRYYDDIDYGFDLDAAEEKSSDVDNDLMLHLKITENEKKTFKRRFL